MSFTQSPGDLTLYQVPQITGSGCAVFDFDQDGRLDILLINQADGAGFEGISEPVDARGGRSTGRLYRQQVDGRFHDVTAGSGLDVAMVGVGVAVGDVDNDGYPDVYISCYGPDKLFLNRRDGTFADITQAAGIDNLQWGASCCFADFDRDGWLDLFVTNYVDYHPTQRCADPGGQQEFCHPKAFTGTPHKLFRNETGQFHAGDVPDRPGAQVRFRDVSLSSGIALQKGPGLGVVCTDFNGDHWPDFFVANDGSANFLWINQRDGTFVEEGVMRGAAYDLLGQPQANMGIAVGDVDGNGLMDLLVTHFAGELNSLYLQQPTGDFLETAGPLGLGEASLPYTKWGAAFFDVEHDGDLDFALVNGRVKRAEGLSEGSAAASPVVSWDSYAEPSQLFLNDGSAHFAQVGSEDEPFCAARGVSRGLSVADIDNDGDLDLLVTAVAGPARLFRNVAKKRGHWLQVRAIEPSLGGRDAYGARITVSAGDRRWIREINPGFSYLVSNDPRAHFGLGDVETIDQISVIWPDGTSEVFPGGEVDCLRALSHGEGGAP